MGRKDLVQLLLSNGGDVTVKNDHEKDSIELSLEVLQTVGMKVSEQKSAEDIADLIRNVKEYVMFSYIFIRFTRSFTYSFLFFYSFSYSFHFISFPLFHSFSSFLSLHFLIVL